MILEAAGGPQKQAGAGRLRAGRQVPDVAAHLRWLGRLAVEAECRKTPRR